MKILSNVAILLGLLLCDTLFARERHFERECSCTIARLWLDVVILFDNMDVAVLSMQIPNAEGVFEPTTITQGEGHHCRIGTVTYGGEAKALHKLTEFNDTEEFLDRIWDIRPAFELTKNLTAGLLAAEQIFQEGRTNDLRKHVKQVIIAYAIDLNESHLKGAKEVAYQLKNSGKTIIVVAVDQGDSIASELMQIASEGFYFTNRIPNLTGEIQHAMCDVNCFCHERWVQYKSNNISFGSCLRIGSFELDWENANDACEHLGRGRGHLATVLDNSKHNFVAVLTRNDSKMEPPYQYHIGLSYDLSKDGYFWEQPKGSIPEKIPIEGSEFRKWNKGFPDLHGHANCVRTAQTSAEFELGWQNEVCDSWSSRHHYVCQMNACDTDNYCPPD